MALRPSAPWASASTRPGKPRPLPNIIRWPVIPRVFHQIWVGPDPVLDGFEEWQASWARHHPAWELRLWRDENLPTDLRNPVVYELDRHPVERADILRLELLFRYGGVYLDADLECVKPIDPLIDGLDFFGMDIKP